MVATNGLFAIQPNIQMAVRGRQNALCNCYIIARVVWDDINMCFDLTLAVSEALPFVNQQKMGMMINQDESLWWLFVSMLIIKPAPEQLKKGHSLSYKVSLVREAYCSTEREPVLF